MVGMKTYEILNDITGEVVDTATCYTDAVGIAEFLTLTTRALHIVPIVEKTLEYAV